MNSGLKTEIKKEEQDDATVKDEVVDAETTVEVDASHLLMEEEEEEEEEIGTEEVSNAEMAEAPSAAIVEGEDGEQQVYIIQTADGEAIPLEGAEVIVAEDTSVVETVSALEQLSRGHVVTEGGELLQVYEEVVLPDGSAAKLDESGEVINEASNPKVGSLTAQQVASTATSTGAVDPATGAEFHICRICNQFVTLEMLPTHNAQAHGHIRDLTCLDCGKLFKSKRSLFGHRKEKHSGMLEVHSCPECGKSFGRKSNLKAHRESLHYGKKFPCVYCERIFTNRSSMNQHIKKTHTSAHVATGAQAAATVVTEGQTVILHPLTTNINL